MVSQNKTTYYLYTCRMFLIRKDSMWNWSFILKQINRPWDSVLFELIHLSGHLREVSSRAIKDSGCELKFCFSLVKFIPKISEIGTIPLARKSVTPPPLSQAPILGYYRCHKPKLNREFTFITFWCSINLGIFLHLRITLCRKIIPTGHRIRTEDSTSRT